MKRIVFLSRSRLSQNLLSLVLESIPNKKIELITVSSLNELQKTFFPKPIHSIILDASILTGDVDTSGLGAKSLQKAQRILIHNRHHTIPSKLIDELRIDQTCTKPFTPEELTNIVQQSIGGAK